MQKTKLRRKSEKYRGPKPVVLMKMTQPVMTIGTGSFDVVYQLSCIKTGWRELTHEEPVSVLNSVGKPGVEGAIKSHENVRGRNEEERNGIVEAKSPGQCREEILETSSTDKRMLCKSQNPDAGILQCELESLNGSLGITTVDIRLCSVQNQPPSCNRSHFGAESLPVLGEVGEEEANHDAGGYSEGTFEDVQPSPSRDASGAVQALKDTSSDQVAKGTRNEGSVVEYCHAKGQFLLGVPFGKIEDDLHANFG